MYIGDTSALRAAPPRLRGRRQLRRRGAGRLLRQHPASSSTPTAAAPSSTTAAAFRSTSTRRRGKSAAEVVLTDAPRRRQVRALGVQGLRRPARRRRLGRQRALASGSRSRSAATGKVYTQRYERGKPQSDLLSAGEKTTKRGTTIRFKPDPEIFEDTTFSLRHPREPPARAGVPEQGPQDRHRGRAGRAEAHTFLYKGGIVEFVEHLNQNKTPRPPQGALLRGQAGRHRGRGRAPVQRRLPGERLLVREQHQHARGRHAPHRLPGGADADDQRLRAGERLPQDLQGRRSPATTSARGSPRSSRCGCRSPSSRGRRRPSSATARCKGLVESIVNDKLAEAFEEDPDHRAEDRREVRARRPGARGGPQGARADAQEGARRRRPARQAGRLLGARPAVPRAVPGRGRLGRRLGEAGPRPADPGDPAAARQDHQRREGALRQGAVPPGDPAPDLGARAPASARRSSTSRSSATTRSSS